MGSCDPRAQSYVIGGHMTPCGHGKGAPTLTEPGSAKVVNR